MDIAQIERSVAERAGKYASLAEATSQKIIDASPEQKTGILFEFFSALARNLAETAYLNVAGQSEAVIGEMHRVSLVALGEGIIEALSDRGIVDEDFVKAAMFAGGDAFHKRFMELDAHATGAGVQ